MSHRFLIESVSKYDFSETVEKLKNHISEDGWKLLHVHDLQQVMRNNGLSVPHVEVFEICYPQYAYRLLSVDNYRIYSNLIPCRISVYEKEDGKTYISRMDIPDFISESNEEVIEVMTLAFNESENIIKKISE